MKKQFTYIRVGTSYYKLVQVPTISRHFNEQLVPWNEHTIKQDHGKDLLSKVPKYDGFACIPCHEGYQREHHGFYNTYSPLEHQPEKGTIDSTRKLLLHIFGNQLELGLDYLKLLYQKPVQVLPILCLVSKERNTGKSTFLKWLKEIFGNNLTYLTNDSFGSQFNADWTNKLLICVDEVLFNKEELTERIKYLSTTNRNKLEAKGKDKREVEFFGKFILCSNNEENFIKIDAHETRFWVRKIPALKREETNFLTLSQSEMPWAVRFLAAREYRTEQRTRMWFTHKEIYTPALKRLVNNNRNRVEKELASLLLSAMEKFDMDSVDLCPIDALHMLNRTRVRTDLTQLRRLLKKDWKMENQRNSNKYQRITIWNNGEINTEDAKGRYFTIARNFLVQNFDDLMTD